MATSNTNQNSTDVWGKGPFKYYVIKKVGVKVRPIACQLFAYKVGGWVWLNAYVIIRVCDIQVLVEIHTI